MNTPLLSLPFALANIFRALTAHLSLSALHAPANHHTPPLAPSRSLTYRCRGAADSGHAASACDVHHKTQQTRHRPAQGFCRRSPKPPPADGWHPAASASFLHGTGPAVPVRSVSACAPPVRVHSVSRSGAKHPLRTPDFRRAGTGCSEA